MDQASADVILSLQAQDLVELHKNAEIDGKELDNGDSKMALDLYKEELLHTAFLLRDHTYSQKVGETDNSDPPSPVNTPTPDFDRVCATLVTSLTIQDGSSLANQSTIHESQNAVTLEVPPDGKACGEGSQVQRIECTAGAGVQDDGNQPVVYSCVACDMCEEENEMIHVPCGDYYCKGCTTKLFKMSMKDESLFLPRCCRQFIPLELVSTVLDAELQKNFKDRAIEFTTIERTYCSQPTCGIFIPPTVIEGEKVKCPECSQITCTICKTAEHEGDCPANPEHQALMELAEKEGYKKCYQCKRLVEISTGCNHMT